MVATKDVGDALGDSAVGVIVVYGAVFVALVGVAMVVAVLWCRPPMEEVRLRLDPNTVIPCW